VSVSHQHGRSLSLCVCVLYVFVRWGEMGALVRSPQLGPLYQRRMVDYRTNHWRNNTDREKPKYFERDLPQCHFDHHEYQYGLSWDCTRVSAVRSLSYSTALLPTFGTASCTSLTLPSLYTVYTGLSRSEVCVLTGRDGKPLTYK
jgi:hypothetical protein